MPPQDWEKYLDDDVRIRVRMTSNRWIVVAFTLQLEFLIDGRWAPAVRCDTAHGEAHFDYLDPAGVTYEKVWLGTKYPYNDAFTFALDELVRIAPQQRQRFERQPGGGRDGNG